MRSRKHILFSVLVLSLCGCGDDTNGSTSQDAGLDADSGSVVPNDGGGNDSSTPATGEPPMLSGITALHNMVRADVSPAPASPLAALTWSTTLQVAAQTWADGCDFSHSSNGYGENIYASTGNSTSAQSVVGAWAGEADDYDYATNSCSGVCGHYTQIVWDDTTQLGCAVRVCTTGSPFPSMYGPTWTFVVCNYDPPGNVGSQKPY